MVDQDKSLASRAAYWLRDRLNARLFEVIDTEGKDVLDVGGGAFFTRLKRRGATWRRYVVLEPDASLLPPAVDGVELEVGSAEDMPFPNDSFDLILAIQVLEHVFDPITATREMYRSLRPGGRIVILVPQSGTLHLVPHHYQNLTRFWLFEQAQRLGATVELWQPIGGSWRTIASRLFLMFWPVLNLHATRDPELRHRSWRFWVLLPVQVVVAAVFFPIAMLLSVGDIKEEANNHLFIVAKPPTDNGTRQG